jgi:MFS family permease
VDVNLVIPWLLSQLTDSRAIVGLAPTLATVGSSLPQLLAAHYVQRDAYRRRYVVRFSAVRVIALSSMLPLLFWNVAGPGMILAVVLGSYAIASFTVGFIALPWQDMTAKTIPARRLSSFFGLRSFIGGILGLGVAQFIRAYLGATPTVPLPKFGLLFLFGTASIGLAALANALVREPAGPAVRERPPLVDQLKRAAALSWGHRPFRYYLCTRGLLLVSSLIAPLYIFEGRSHYGLLAESIGTFTTAGLAAGIVASLGWSLLGDRLGLARLCRIVAGLSLAPPVLALAMPILASSPVGPIGGWLLVFLLLGAAATGQQNVSFRGVLVLPPPESRSLMIGFGNTCSGVISLVGPCIGLLADAAGAPAAYALAVAATVAVGFLAAGIAAPQVHAAEAQG